MKKVSEKERKAWEKAKQSQIRCNRCIAWNKMGLSYYCPDCDAEILEKYFFNLNKK